MRRFEIADVTLVRPRVDVAPRAAGGSNWTPLIAELVHLGEAGSLHLAVVLRGQDPGRHADLPRRRPATSSETVTGANMSLAWPSITRSFAATGEFDWHGARVDGSLSMSDFVAAMAGERSGVKARIASAPLKFAFDGAVANGASLMLDGTLTAEAASLREALRWLRAQLPGSTPDLAASP